MKFKHYYHKLKKCFPIPFISQLHKSITIFINISSTATHNSNPTGSMPITIDICNWVQKKCYAHDRITIRLGIYGTVDAVTCIIVVLIHVSICASLLYLSTIVFEGIDLNFDKSSEFECRCSDNSDVTIMLRNTSAIRGTTDLVGFYSVDIYVIIQRMDESPSNMALSVEFYLIVVKIIQTITHLAIQSSGNVLHCYTQVIRNVCGVFCCLFAFCAFFGNCNCDIVYEMFQKNTI